MTLPVNLTPTPVKTYLPPEPPLEPPSPPPTLNKYNHTDFYFDLRWNIKDLIKFIHKIKGDSFLIKEDLYV